MSDEQIKQRIAYLVEHGGLWDDPLEDIRAQLRRLWWVATLGVCGFGVLVYHVLLFHF
jgi:hypothetical protein